MSNAIEKAAGMDLLQWTQAQRDLIKRTVAKDATDDELAMFLHIAARAGMDPLLRQIHFMKYQGRVTIVADINGLQARAAREADFEGITHAVVCEGDDFAIDNVTGQVVRHTSNPLAGKGAPLGAWATVFRRNMKPFTAVVRFAEYKNTNNPLWGTKPAVMIDKVAKSTALRLAYPEQLGSVYEPSEMDREVEVNAPPASVTPIQQAKGADLKAQIAARVQAKTDAVDAEIVPEKPAEPKPPTPWERIQKLGADAGMDTKAIGATMRTLGRTKIAALTEDDVAAFALTLQPPPAHADAEPPLEDAPF